MLNRVFSARIVRLMLVLAWLVPVYALGQSSTDDTTTPVASEQKLTSSRLAAQYVGAYQQAPVIVNGEMLFNISGFPSLPAQKRARVYARNIAALAENPKFDPDSIKLEESVAAHTLYAGAGGSEILSVVDEDAKAEGASRLIVAELYKDKVAEIIREYRYERKPEVLRQNIIRALIRTLGLAITLIAINWLFRRLDAWLEKQVKTRIEALEAKSLSIIQAEHIWNVFRAVLRLFRILLVFIIVYVFLHFVLNLFPWTRFFAATALNYVTNPLRIMGLAVLGYLPSLFFLVLLYYITRYVLKLVHQFFVAVEHKRITLNSFDTEWALPTYRIVRMVIILMAIVLAYPYIPGSDSQAFKGISLIFGVLFSLGSTSVVSNVIAGYTMTYRRAFRVGDRVKIGNTIGDVLETRILVTRVRSLKNEEVVIPNSTILNNEVINFSRLADQDGLILHTSVGIGYEVPWRQVEAMLLLAAAQTKGLLKRPRPFVLQTSLSDFAVNYELNAYCKDEKRAAILYSTLHGNIQDIFNENEISIMTPAYEADTSEPKIVPKDQWYTAPAKED